MFLLEYLASAITCVFVWGKKGVKVKKYVFLKKCWGLSKTNSQLPDEKLFPIPCF